MRDVEEQVAGGDDAQLAQRGRTRWTDPLQVDGWSIEPQSCHPERDLVILSATLSS
jgi:hypothetical protein